MHPSGEPRAAGWIALLASVGAHLGVGAYAADASWPIAATPSPEVAFVELSIDTFPEALPPAPRPSPPPEITPAPDLPAPVMPVRSVRTAVMETADAAPSAIEAPEPEPPAATPPERELPSLAPARVAWGHQAMSDAPDPPPAAPSVERPPPPSEEELERALTAHLRAEASRRDHLSERPPPVLRRRRDGSYAYRGPDFEAIIDPRGEVHFSDRSGRSYDGWRVGAAGASTRPQGFRLRFDPTRRAEARHGNDVLAAERAWFMEETADLRERLVEEAQAQLTERGVLAVRVAVERIFDDRASSPAARRARIFRLWDDCTEDAAGVRAREAIEAFVRRHLRQGTPEGYDAAELTRLNAERASELAFDPYTP